MTNWKNGDPDFIRQLFLTASEAEQKRFHSRRLVPLYFDTLNRQRPDNLFEITGTRVPYLNGGLFERDFDGVEKIDFPPELFTGLLEFFGQYNFTIDENDPDDHEIGIDPEMLGQIFENLLEDNKNKGAFYTPKAVVQYMCQQSLIHALASHFPNDPVARVEITKLIRTKEPVDLSNLTGKKRHAVKLFGTEQTELGLKAVSTELTVEFEEGKQAEISSLIGGYFDQTDPDLKKRLHRQIDELVLGHIEYNLDLHEERIEAALDNARKELKRKKASARGYQPTKKEAGRIAELETQLVEVGRKRAALAELQKKPERPFFLWHLFFQDVFARGGFDIVIANPPYVRQEAIKDQKPALQAERYECFSGTADLYVYFYELASKVLCQGGVIVFISSNSFLNAAFGEKLRGFLAKKHKIHELIDFGEADVFAAVTEPLIITATKEKPADGANVRVMKWREENKVEYIAQRFAVAEVNVSQKTLVDDIWKIESAPILRLLEKLSENGTPFGTLISSKIFWGLKTALNEAYVVDESTRTRLVAEHPSSSKILRPFLRGKDVSRWSVNLSRLYLIRIESSANKKHPWSGKPQAEAKKIFEQTYPAIARWLAPFKDKLVARDDQGNYYWELRSCDYWDEFATPKIIYQDIARYFGMAWDDSGSLLVNTCYFIPNAEKWMLGILLSSTMRFYVEKSLGSDEGGFIRLFTIHVEKFPFPKTSEAEQSALSGLVDRILAAKRTGDAAKVQDLESEIDTHVFRLYALTPAEIDLVKGTAKA